MQHEFVHTGSDRAQRISLRWFHDHLDQVRANAAREPLRFHLIHTLAQQIKPAFSQPAVANHPLHIDGRRPEIDRLLKKGASPNTNACLTVGLSFRLGANNP